MGLFGRNTRNGKEADAAPEPTETEIQRRPGDPKGRPTMTRKQAEAERRRRLQMSPQERKKAAKEAQRRHQQEAWAARDQTPEKELMRDVVDTRWNLAEFLLPILLLNLAASVALPQYTNIIAVVMYAYLVLTIADLVLAWRKYRGLLRDRMPRLTDLKGLGLRMYLVNRSISLRPMRNPKPRLKRSERP